ncbi:hypothetical protein D3C80_1885820 [compost metagenome]
MRSVVTEEADSDLLRDARSGLADQLGGERVEISRGERLLLGVGVFSMWPVGSTWFTGSF